MPTLFLHLILFVITTSVTNLILPVHNNCLEAQKQILLHFKNSLVFNSSKSSRLITWDSNTDCCSWLGVTCSTNGRVVGLDLSREYISCNINNSSSLFQLQHLQSLNLAHNDFNATSIPSAIGKLTELRYLDLSSLSFSGKLPIEISHLTRLVTLDLSRGYQELKFENPNVSMLIQNLTELQELRLDSVNLGNDWCKAISSSLPDLRVLSLSSSGLSGPICESLAKLRSLYEIDLSFNPFFAPVPTVFANFTNLISLSLYTSDFLGTFPKQIFQLPTLKSIDLSDNPELQGSLPEFSKNGSLKSLVLTGTNKFSGVLPDSVGNLKKLSRLDLSYCNFSGAVPKSLANLTQLRFLALVDNKFSCQIDSIQWDKLIKLELLDLAYNLLYGSIPLSPFSIPLLERLVLSGNHFSGQLLEFSNVSSHLLHELDLSRNSLEGSIPLSVFNLSKLDKLYLFSNNLSGFPFYGLQKPRTLSFLDLSHNNLFNPNSTNSLPPSLLKIRDLNLASNQLKAFPHFLKNQSRLTSLDLSNNHIPGQIPNWIWELLPSGKLHLCCNQLVSLEAPLPGSTYNLWKLDLHSNRLQGQIPLFVSADWYLDYSRNNFSSPIPIDIGDFLGATGYLSLSSNNLHGIIPRSICNASDLVLDLSNNSLSGIIPQCLTQIHMMSVLDLSRNNLTGSIPDNFPKGCVLETLSLSRNQIQGRFPKSLANCGLYVLDLGYNHITDTFPCQLKILYMFVLVLRSNKFYGPIGCLESNCSWSSLQIIDLAHNSFNGGIPGRLLTTWLAMMVNHEEGLYLFVGWSTGSDAIDSDIIYRDAITTTSKGVEMDLLHILSSFTSIDFSANNFSGAIPKEIGLLRSLLVLNLSVNAFTGEIPSSIGNMTSLESLDLSMNHLSGHIPPQLANLSFLSYLNVSENQLTGRIPTSTQFSTFPNTSFRGNRGLWGPPLTVFSPPPAAASKAIQHNLGDEIDWDVLNVEIGFTCGFGIAVASLLVCKRWRKWYYKAMFNFMFKIFPQLEERFGNHRRHVHINQRFSGH